jgi:glycosyltransferase involved in cell wall biosynthesis
MNHIAFVIPSLDRVGGAEGQVIQLADGLLARGWRISVVALSGNGGEAAQKLIASGAAFLSLKMRKGLVDPRGWLRFHRWLRHESPDLVHAHLPHAVWMARWSRLCAPVPVVLDSIHTSAIGSFGRRIGYRASSWLPDHTCAVSQDAANTYQSARMVLASRLTVLQNGVDVDFWHPDAAQRDSVRKSLRLTDQFLWFAAGRLDPVKDYPVLLRAMAEIPRLTHLIIAGAGSREYELRRLIDELRLDERVRLLGFQSNVRPWMQAADGFVLSSRWEGLPTCLLEAGACCLPAVATAVAGTREVIIHGKTGFLATPCDSSALRSEMIRMMQLSWKERTAMGQNARQHIAENFRLSSVLDRWEALYRELLERNLRLATARTSMIPNQ